MKTGLFRLGLLIYAASLVAFAIEFIAELTGFGFYYIGWNMHEFIEIMTLIGFLTGLYFIWQAQKLLAERGRLLSNKLKTASGAFQEGLEGLFAQWGLSNAEKEVALLTIKGMSINEISSLRQTSIGTVKAQSSAIYRKTGVNSRAQLVSLIIEELLE